MNGVKVIETVVGAIQVGQIPRHRLSNAAPFIFLHFCHFLHVPLSFRFCAAAKNLGTSAEP